MRQIGSIEEKVENVMQNLTILFSDKFPLTFMAISPLVAIDESVIHPGFI
jgi:hypothetical protein